MKNNGKNKNLIRIAAMTSMTIFSLMAVFTGTLAWFNANRIINNGADSMQISSLGGKLKSISFHSLSAKNRNSDGKLVSFEFNKTPSGTITYNWSENTGTYIKTSEGDTRIELNRYTPLDQEQPLMLLFELDQEYSIKQDGSIYIKGITEKSDFLGTKDKDNVPAHSLKNSESSDYDDELYMAEKNVTIDAHSMTAYYYAMSSVVQFYSHPLSDAAYTAFSSGSTYLLDSNLNNLSISLGENKTYTSTSRAEKFVTVDNEEETSSFDADGSVDFYSSRVGEKAKYVVLFVDYYPDAIEYIYSTYLGDDVLEDEYDGYLFFSCDWALEVF